MIELALYILVVAGGVAAALLVIVAPWYLRSKRRDPPWRE